MGPSPPKGIPPPSPSPSQGGGKGEGFLSKRLSGLTTRVRRAFALEPEGQPLSPEDMALLERVAATVVERGMATPAILFLESVGPMNFLGSQALHFFAPILEVVFPQRDVERVAHLLERRDTLSRLTALIEQRTATRP
jgi:hypothetical protein